MILVILLVQPHRVNMQSSGKLTVKNNVLFTDDSAEKELTLFLEQNV